MSRAQADEEIIVLDSIGSPALSFAVPAALRLLSTQIERARQQKPALRAVTGEGNVPRSHLLPQL